MQSRIIALFISACVLFMSCSSSNSDKEGKSGVLIEAIQTSSYTYMKLQSERVTQWFATGKVQVEKGKTYYYADELQMIGFHSKELNRTFDTIFFLNNISNVPVAPKKVVEPENGDHHNHENCSHSHHDHKTEVTNKPEKPLEIEPFGNISLKPVDGTITIGELFKNGEKYAGKRVNIQGVVVKFNKAIMDKNWIHIHDGTSYNREFDLTATTQELVTVGDTVILNGFVTLSKDYGHGYSYDVILEDTKVK